MIKESSGTTGGPPYPIESADEGAGESTSEESSTQEGPDLSKFSLNKHGVLVGKETRGVVPASTGKVLIGG